MHVKAEEPQIEKTIFKEDIEVDAASEGSDEQSLPADEEDKIQYKPAEIDEYPSGEEDE